MKRNGKPVLSVLLSAMLTACPESDRTQPAVTLTSSLQTVSVGGSTRLTATATDDTGIARVEFLDETSSLGTDDTAPYEFIASGFAKPGQRTFTARAYDLAGNSSDTKTSLTVSSGEAPVITAFNASETSVRIGNSIRFKIEATDDLGVTNLELLEVGKDAPLKTVPNATTLEFDLLMSAGGKRRFTARASDAGGNVTTRELEVSTRDPVLQLASGDFHTCALLFSGNVRCWGRNDFGQLGTRSRNDIGDDEPASSAPFVNIGGQVTQLSAGSSHTCALLVTGTVRCWGLNDNGQLGYGNSLQNRIIGDNEDVFQVGDVSITTSGVNVIQVSAGRSHTCALLEDGAVKCWGLGFRGQLGYGNTDDIGDDENPSSVGFVDFGTPFQPIQIAAGSFATCASDAQGSVRCWGEGSAGQLGNGSTLDIGGTPSTIHPVTAQLGTLATKRLFTSATSSYLCRITLEDAVQCWGFNSSGQLGYGNTDTIGDDEAPSTTGNVNLGGERVRELATGFNHTCVILENGSLECWGDNFSGQLGYANTNPVGADPSRPTSSLGAIGVTTDNLKVAQVVAGFLRTCVLLETGDVKCWGDNGRGALGYGNTENIGDDESPSSVDIVPLF
jgi:alpha-tubulin suppressor-like RCC1 family protein